MELRYYHYYRELAPAMQRYALIAAGYSPPADDAPYLEAGIRPRHVGGHSCGRPREDQGANSFMDLVLSLVWGGRPRVRAAFLMSVWTEGSASELEGYFAIRDGGSQCDVAAAA